MVWRFDLADVAHYQDEAGAPIDWGALIAGSPGNGAITKATQRNNYADPTMPRHRSEMKRVGARRRGLYHWQSPVTQASIASQVAHYRRTVGTLEQGEFFMSDSEELGATEPDCYEELNLVEDWSGRPSAVYCGVYTDGGRIWRSERIRMSRWGPRFMILAAYLSQDRLAQLLKSLKVDGLPAHMNQFGSSGVLPTGGHVPGVVGRCDMNQVNDYALLDICCGYSAAQQPGDDDEMITEADIWKDTDSPGDKFVLKRDDGVFRPISATELSLLGITLTAELGRPVSRADRDALDAVAPQPGTGAGPGVPHTISLDIPSVPGRATGSLS